MKKNLFFMAALAMSTLISCGGSSKKDIEKQDKTTELKPYETKIKGYLSDVLEVSDGSYKFESKQDMFLEGKIQVKIKSIGQGNAKDYGLQDGNHGPLYLTVCSKDGQPLAEFSNIASDYESDGLLKDMVSKVGEENWILFGDSFMKGQLPDEATTFIVTSKQIEEDKRVSSDSSNSNSDDEEEDALFSESGDENWDDVLDDYENYVDKYLEVIKKANNDDAGALLEYPDLLEKSKKLEKSLDKAKNAKSLNAKQVKRMTKIQMKMVEAASEIGGN